ncbi:hypothetical protein I4U23_000071 [Adineta vaga]|nr:hypothetical protein I4U23_000071 [Adineta vaga]
MPVFKEGEELVGSGVKSQRINAPYDAIWDAMMDSVYHPEKYLSFMKMLSIEDHGDHIVRVSWQGDPHQTTEKIYCDKEKGEIKFSAPMKVAIVHRYNRDTQVLEEWLELKTGHRLPWMVAKSVIVASIQKTKELAETQSK